MQSSCKVPSFYVWKTWGRFSDNFCDYFVFRVCYGFRVMFMGGGLQKFMENSVGLGIGDSV